MPAVCSCGQDGQLSAVSYRGVRRGSGRYRFADGGQPLCLDSWAGEQRVDPPEPGAGPQLAGRHHRAAGCRRVHSDRSGQAGHRQPAWPTRCGCPTSALPRAAVCWALPSPSCTCRTSNRRSIPSREGRRSDLEPQHLELQAHRARCAGHLLLCRRRSGAGLDRGELLQTRKA